MGIDLQPSVSDTGREGCLWKGMVTSMLTLAKAGDEPPNTHIFLHPFMFLNFFLNLSWFVLHFGVKS